MKSHMLSACMVLFFVQLLNSGCVSHVYRPGMADNPLNRLRLGQTYNDMVKQLGEPDNSREEDRTLQEMAVLFLPVWNLVEAMGDYNPSTIQVYTYKKYGSVTLDNNNRIIRIEANH